MRIFVCVFLSCLLFACADIEKSDQLKRVNILLENVDSLLIVLNQINEPQLSREIEENNKLLSDLTMRASDDTLVEKEARLVDKYANCISKLSSLKIRMENLKSALDEQKSTIGNLEKDIENVAGKRDLYDENLNFEEKKFNLIEKEINSIKTKKIDFLDKIANFKIKSRELIQNLNQNK
jgi:chromosome segregation ATPase